MTLLAITIASAFLMPLAYMVATALKDQSQMTAVGAPLYPAAPETFIHEGEELTVYDVPMPDGSIRALALVQPHREDAIFIDPANPAGGEIEWVGRWRTLQQHWAFSLKLDNFTNAWNSINFPLLFFNTIAIATLSTIGAVGSAIFVAYGFSRFRFPGRERPVHPDGRDDHPAVPGDVDPVLRVLPGPGLGGDVAAADRAPLLRQRLQRLPAAAVLPDDPARPRRGRR